MYFRDIPGKEAEKAALIQAVNDDKIPHAQLLLGRAGGGNLPLALALASYILCADRGTTDSCGSCASCIKSHKYAHPDLHFAFPVIKQAGLKREETSSNSWLKEWRLALAERPYMDITGWQSTMGAENSQPNINKKECLDIVHKLGMKSFESRYKVLILWQPEYLGKEGNRLLKLIEEPAPDTIIIMVATKQEDILNTIISRVQITKITPFKMEEVATELITNHAVEESLARQIAVMADANLGRAIDMVSGEHTHYSDALFEWIRIAYKMEPVSLQQWIDQAANWGREGQKNFLDYSLHFFREYIFWQLSGSSAVRLSAAEMDTAQKMVQIIDIDKAEKIVHLLDKAYRAVVRNANVKILLTADSMKLAYIMRGRDHEPTLYVT